MHDRDSQEQKAPAGTDTVDFAALAAAIKRRAQEMGFAGAGIAPAWISTEAKTHLQRWLDSACHGGMDYMAKHASLRADPQALLPGTLSIISVRLPYWHAETGQRALTDRNLGNISRYALGRDYHKTVRQRLQKLADFIQAALGDSAPSFAYRVFSDSAPVMETELASRCGVGWRGKHTLTLTREGSWHFLGEIYTNLPLPPDPPAENHCGHCQRCVDACPTGAIIAPYRLDARRCISYLTIEHQGPIPVEFRRQIGNRIYGCDDCQSVCPWNRFAKCGDADFAARAGLSDAPLTELFAWSATSFEARLAGSPIRRIGHERWLRNIAVALGNAGPDADTMAALAARRDDPSPLVREHVAWALDEAASFPDKRS